MTKTTTQLHIGWLLLVLYALSVPASAQTQPLLTERDAKNINAAAIHKLKDLNDKLNQLTFDDRTAAERDTIIKYSYTPNPQQVFANSSVVIEDDIDPTHTSATNTVDMTVEEYLRELFLQYTKTAEPNTIVFSKQEFSPVQQTGNSIFIKAFFKSEFKGRHTKIDKPYQPSQRVAEMRAEKVNKYWVVYITRLGFLQPGEGIAPIAQMNGRPTIPANLTINSADVLFRQPDRNQFITLKFNKFWLQVVKTEDTDVPVGFYKRVNDDYVFDNLNSIKFDNNNRRFIFHKGLSYSGFERVLPAKTTPLKPDSVSLPPVIVNKSARKPANIVLPNPDSVATQRAIATATKPASNTATVSSPDKLSQPIVALPVDSARLASKTRRPRMNEPTTTSKPPGGDLIIKQAQPDSVRTTAIVKPKPEQIKKVKPEKSIVAIPDSKTLAPDLANALSAEAKKQKARYRTLGWLQIVAGVAGLAGSYIAYSSIKKDYDGYTAQVTKLNADYDIWREMARQPAGSLLSPMSISGYGKPGIYGVYGGGVVSVGLVLNGISFLKKAGKIKPKATKK